MKKIPYPYTNAKKTSLHTIDKKAMIDQNTNTKNKRFILWKTMITTKTKDLLESKPWRWLMI
jgi:hypothetical protein